jgi:nucleoside-diphosphate-sugar epimerase
LNLLSECRRLERPPVFVFASSTAVYGGDLPERVADSLRLTPTTSYGTQKAVGELLVNDFSRKGFIDGRAFRFPTVVVRPGAPNRALSSFVSSIIRDPLQGREAVCPVADDVRVFILSPRMLIRNLVHGVELPAETLGLDRAMTFPGLRVSTGEILGALRDIAGNEVADRIVKRPDRLVAEVVSGWPGDIASERARALGFVADTDVRDIITAFIEDELDGGPSVER